jgi:8-oxo-dGTP pyrophosphatase MutT (NUDIX family)
VSATELAPDPPAPADRYHAGVRPRDAASLIVVRADRDATRVLMGTRHHGHRFMPGKVVFPGGRVDRADYGVRGAGALPAATKALLVERMRGRPSERRARAIALAAIRETYEETGLLLGCRAEPHVLPRGNAAWGNFLRHGIAPDLAPLNLIARAITPPGQVRRFDTRFFLTTADAIACETEPPSDELGSLSWLTFEEARRCNIPLITAMVLDIAERRTRMPAAGPADMRAPFFHWRRGRRVIDEIAIAGCDA